MPIGAIVGATAVSAGVGLYSANKAAKAQEKASKEASKASEAATAQARADLAPWRQTGQSALYSLADMYGLRGGDAFSDESLEAFRRSPDYQVALKEGIRATDMSAATRGNLLSGGQVKRVQELGSDIASRYFGSYMDRLSALATGGQNAAAGQANTSMANGTNQSNLALGKGEAQAAGIVGGTNAITGALGTGLQNYMTYSNIPKSPGPTNIVPPRY